MLKVDSVTWSSEFHAQCITLCCLLTIRSPRERRNSSQRKSRMLSQHDPYQAITISKMKPTLLHHRLRLRIHRPLHSLARLIHFYWSVKMNFEDNRYNETNSHLKRLQAGKQASVATMTWSSHEKPMPVMRMYY